MPYSRFISRWFANVPNINLGIMQALLNKRGRSARTFHFHLDFLPYLKSVDARYWENFLERSERFGVEYMGIDYVFASLLFENTYARSKNLIGDRLESMGLRLDDFETMRNLAGAF